MHHIYLLYLFSKIYYTSIYNLLNIIMEDSEQRDVEQQFIYQLYL